VRLVEFVHSVVVGPRRRRLVFAVIGFVLFSAAVLGLVLGALWLDARFRLRPLVPATVGLVTGVPLFVLGVIMVSWCMLIFRLSRGTPVPFSPPRELVVSGPYRYTRNPMLTGLFATVAGAGLFLRSPSIVLVALPVLVIGAYLELKIIEEPELRRRLGAPYVEYARRVPMFLPRLWHCKGGSDSGMVP
jgi:protein-S-isoprenylcysteine O-methyltransferase Ste14